MIITPMIDSCLFTACVMSTLFYTTFKVFITDLLTRCYITGGISPSCSRIYCAHTDRLLEEFSASSQDKSEIEYITLHFDSIL